jgi:nucleotide-binding universal stress UspA family protein
MATTQLHTTSLDADVSPPFGHVICGVDGSPAALEAVRQAGALVGPDSTIQLVAVVHEWGADPTAGARLSHAQARQALQTAELVLGESPAYVITRIVRGHPAWSTLLAEAHKADLLVLGRHGNSRAGGIVYGSTATNVIHRGRLPLLIAHEPPAGAAFPGRILVAADGPGHPEDAVRAAAMIARHAGTTDITLLRLDWSRQVRRPEISEAVADVTRVTGAEPVEIMLGGAPHRHIREEAEWQQASLIVMGTRGLTGVRSLWSVSERVAHEAPCSVLIFRRNHAR